MADKEIDQFTGTQTTGHEWDGIKELDTPMPRWWLWTFYATIVWAVGYWVLYPSWPTLSNYVAGSLGYSSRAELNDTLAARDAERAPWMEKFAALSVDDIAKDKDLLNYAMAGGKQVFAENCAPCHGSGGAGSGAYPVLADDDWLWGGSLQAIETTIRYGIRSGHDDARLSEMSAFGRDQVLNKSQITDVAEFVLSLGGRSENREAADRGQQVFADNCTGCHGAKGEGIQSMGAPRLSDGIWLYGSDKASIEKQISLPKHGVMPAWDGRLADTSIKQVTVYVHSLGGGE